MKLSNLTCRIWDYGLFTFLAQTLAEDFGRVELFVPWADAFCKPEKRWIGRGIPGVTRIWEFWEDLDSVDTFCFFDVGDYDTQQELVRQERAVFGTGAGKLVKGDAATELEIDRVLFKETLAKRGLATPKWKVITGIDNLREMAVKMPAPFEKGFWVKPNVGERGVFETFFIKDYKTVRSKLDMIAHDLGVARDACEFMCESHIEGVEPGCDYFTSKGIPFETGLYGWEVKGDGYSARVMDLDKMPNALRKVNEAMAPVYKQYEISAHLSTEVRYGKDRIPYYIDCCARVGNPPGASVAANYKNLPQIVRAIAHGETVKPEFRAPYVSEVSVEAMEAADEPVPLEMKDKDYTSTKIRTVCKIGDQYWHIPFKLNGTTVVKAVGLGKTLEESQYNCLEAAEKFDCPGKSYNKSVFQELDEKLAEGKKYNLPSL
jgi:hypothetical protein